MTTATTTLKLSAVFYAAVLSVWVNYTGKVVYGSTEVFPASFAVNVIFVCLSFLDLTFSFARPVVVGYSRQTHACYDAASRLASEECIYRPGDRFPEENERGLIRSRLSVEGVGQTSGKR